MLNVRASFSILAGCSIVLVACGGAAGGKKVAIRKGDRSTTANSWIKDADIQEKQEVVSTEKSSGKTVAKNGKIVCLSLPKLAAKLRSAGTKDESKNELLAVYTYDLDFVTLESGDNSKPVIVKSVTGQDQIAKQKAFFFFQLNKELARAESVGATAFGESNLGKQFFNVVAQDGCKSVTFRGEQKTIVSYDIVNQTPRRLVLLNKNGGDIRIYERDGASQFRVAAISSAKVGACAGVSASTYSIKSEYMIARARDLNQVTISRNLAELLNQFSGANEKIPELEQQLAAGTKGKRFGASRVRLSGYTHSWLMSQVAKGEAGRIGDCQP